MTTVESVYTGELRTRATHVRSGQIIETDAPPDNQGKGEAFSPTDLLAAALGSCMLTLMGIKARNHDFNVDGTHVSITKTMASDPRRVSKIEIIFRMPAEVYTHAQKRLLEHAARNCPVAKSIHPDITQEITFHYHSN